MYTTLEKTKQIHLYSIKATTKRQHKNYYFLRNTNKKHFLTKRTGGKNNVKNESNIKPKIINLSTHKLNKDQINLLKLSLKFCPTPKSTIGKLKKTSKNLKENLG